MSKATPDQGTAKPMVVKGHCPNCGAGIKADIKAEFRDQWNDNENGIWGDDHHLILRCRGCERVYFQTSAVFSEDDPGSGPTITHWPSPEKRKQPRWLLQMILKDRQLRALFREAYAALNAGSPTLTAIGLRTIFDHSTEKLGVDISLTFAEKLAELVRLGKIGADEQTILDVLTDAGSAAAHRGWEPTDEQLNTMFDIVEGFVHRNFFIHRAATELKGSVPPKPPRKKTGAAKKIP